MPVTFVPEDGTGLPNSNAFVTYNRASHPAPDWMIDAAEYWENRARTLPDSTTEDGVLGAIVRGTFYLSESFEWKGIRRNGRQDRDGFQALAWPRYDVVDREGHNVDIDRIPREVMWATCEAAYQELTEPHSLVSPTHNQNNVIKSVTAGSAKVEYATDQVSVTYARPQLIAIRDLIGPFLAAGSSGGGYLVGRAIRG